MYKLLFVIVLFQLLSSCQRTVEKTVEQTQLELIAGTGDFSNLKRTWRFDSCYINKVSVALTAEQKKYKKTFYTNGVFEDSDNNKGVWEIVDNKKLKQTIVYPLVNKTEITLYEIQNMNAVSLSLGLILPNGDNAVYIFAVNN